MTHVPLEVDVDANILLILFVSSWLGNHFEESLPNLFFGSFINTLYR